VDKSTKGGNGMNSINGLDYETVDEVSLKLSGIIGVFDLIVDNLSGDINSDPRKSTMLDFAYYISNELQSLYKTLNGIDLKG
jgi:hypothetical protein